MTTGTTIEPWWRRLRWWFKDWWVTIKLYVFEPEIARELKKPVTRDEPGFGTRIPRP